MPDHHVKGQPSTSTYVREKGGVKKDSNRETPCTTVHQKLQRTCSGLTSTTTVSNVSEAYFQARRIAYKNVGHLAVGIP